MKLIVFLGLLLITQAVQEPSRQADIQSKNDKQTPLVRALLNMGELAQLSQQIDFSRLINAIDELQTLVEDSLAQETSLFQQDFLSYSSDQEFYKNQISQFETEVATHQVDLSDLLQSRDGLQKLLGEKAEEQAETARISGDLSNNIKDDEKVYFASLQEYDEAIEALDEALELLNGELSLVQVEQIQGSSDRIKNRLQKLRVFYQPIVLALAQLNQSSFADSELYSKVRKILNELRASLAASRINLTNSYEAIRSDNLAIFEQYQDRLNNLSDIIIPQIKEDIGTVDGQISTKQSLLKDAQANLDSAEESLQATETAWIARQKQLKFQKIIDRMITRSQQDNMTLNQRNSNKQEIHLIEQEQKNDKLYIKNNKKKNPQKMKNQDNPQAVSIIEHKREKKSIYYKKLPLPSVPTRLMEKSDLLAAQIHKLVAQMSSGRRQAKAERHIYDAYYLRSVRNDIDLLDRRSLKILWSVENHPYWQTLLFLISLIYQILTFFEQPFPTDIPENGNIIMLELVILIFFLSDVLVTIILMATKPAEGKFNFNLKRALNITLVLFCFSDFISYIIDSKQYRFSRIIRPLIMIFHSKDLRRNLGGIVKAGKDLVLLILLYCIVISVFSFIGINLIGTIPDIDLDNQDYGDFFKLFNMLLMVATLDYYPDILLPPMLVSTLYVAFFVIYLLLFIFLFQPIPLAVVYEGFRKHRMQIAINDIIKQKSAMMAAFISLDQYDKGYLTEKQFKTFLTCFYRDTLLEEDQQKLFSQIDKDFKYIYDINSDKIQFDEFYQLINIIQNGNTIKMPQWSGFLWWNFFRNFINRYLKFKKIIESSNFSMVMLAIVLFNCCTIITAFFIDDPDILAVFDLLDSIFLSIFATEVVVKIIGLGIRAYFDDGWNVFDISLVVLQFLFDYVLFSIIQGNLSQGLKANRILRLAKIQKVFRLFRAFRSIKLIGFLISGFAILGDVKDLLYKIIMCVPLIIRLMLPVQIVFYIFSVLGMYLFGQLNFDDNPYQNNLCYLNGETYQWSNCIYTDFTTLVNAYLMMLQTFIASQWGQTVFLLSHSMKSLWVPMVFMGAFIFSSIFLVALIGGLVWEVFIVVSISLKQEQIMQEEEELLQLESENPLFSSVGTVTELKQTSGNSTATNQRLKKQTQILNDDNPDVIQIRQRSQAIKSRSSREENDYKYYIPQEYTERIKIEQYNLLPAGGSKSASVKRNSKRNSLMQSENELEELKGGILSLYFEQFQSYDQFLNYKFDSENLSIQNITQEYIVHLRNEIKKDEIIQTKTINIQNQDQLIQNAVLRDTTEMQIRLQEEKHFKNLYGQQFERIKELKFQSKFKIESKILFSMMGILKFPKTNIKYFFQILYLIENQLTYQLLPDYSFWKMIHQIDGVWYLINFEDKQIVFTKIKKGPWNYANELFDNTKLRLAENISFIKNQRSVNTKYFLKSFQNSLQMITQLFDIDHKLIHPKSCLMLYDIKNKNFTGDSIRARTMHRRFKQKRASNFTLDLDEAPNPNNFQFNNSNGSEIQDVKQKFVSRTMMVVLYKNQGIDPRIIFQNQVLLLQFIQDLGTVIENYQHHFFQQIEELYVLRNQIGKIN